MLMEKVSAGQCSFLCSYDAICARVVENTGLISLIGISDFRQMEGTRISNIRRHKNQFGLGTHETCHGWQRRWLQWHQAQCNLAFLDGIRSLQNM
jgi:hypothetical protein